MIEAVPSDAFPESVLAGLRQGFEPMIASYLARAGKGRFCDKSLGGAVHSRLLRAMWPDALFISLYRHPMDVIVWKTSAIAGGSVGRGWDVPARLIPPPLLADVNALAEKLGYLPVGPDWGTGPPPANVRREG